MVKIILSLSFSLFLIGLAMGQHLSLNIGANYSNFKTERGGASVAPYYKYDIGYTLGTSLVFNISENFFINSSILFIRSTFKYNIAEDGVDGDSDIIFLGNANDDVNINLKHLYINPAFGYSISKRFLFFAGPQIGFLISDQVNSDPNTPRIDTHFKNSDIGYNLNLSIEVLSGLFLRSTYYHSLSDIGSDVSNSQEDYVKMKTRRFSLSLNYIICKINRD